MNKAILSNLSFPEGPAIAPNGDIWFVELHGGNVCRYTPQGVVRRYHINGGSPNGIAIDSKGRIWFCDAGKNCVSILYPESGDVKTACAEVGGEPLASPNDLAFDSKGNLLFTCPGDSRKSPDGYVCVLSRGRAKKIADGKYFPNGLALTPDGNSPLWLKLTSKDSGKAVGIQKHSNGQTLKYGRKQEESLALTEWLLEAMATCTLQCTEAELSKSFPRLGKLSEK